MSSEKDCEKDGRKLKVEFGVGPKSTFQCFSEPPFFDPSESLPTNDNEVFSSKEFFILKVSSPASPAHTMYFTPKCTTISSK